MEEKSPPFPSPGTSPGPSRSPTPSDRCSPDLIRGGSLMDRRSILSDFSSDQRPKTSSQAKLVMKLTDDQSIQNAIYKAPSDLCKLVQNVYFNKRGDAPKIHMPYQTNPGYIPRRLGIERLRREYLNLDFEQLLAEREIDSSLLVPRPLSKSAKHHITPESPSLPLELFDNEDYDCRTSDGWLALGQVEGSDRKPIPAKALLPDDDAISDDPRSPSYCWHLVGVLDYCKVKCQYLVEKLHENTIEKDYKVIKNLGACSQHWVPRIRLYFSAEDPHIFADRIQFALRYRESTEALCLYHLSVNCMQVCPGTPSINADTLQRVKCLVLSTPGLTLNGLESYVEDLEKEIKLEYDWIMNQMIFEKCVTNSHEELSNITLPQKESAHVPQKGCVSVPYSTYEENKAAFIKKTLFRRPEVISVLTEIWSETRQVAAMKLFNMTSTTALHLDKIEDVQTSLHSQINLFLRKTFVPTLANIIRSNLPVGKGAFNINVSRWDIYKLCDLSKLMTVIRLNLQDSLRFLVQDSLTTLVRVVRNSCCSVMTCSEDMVWGSDLINSPYQPFKCPVFVVNLILHPKGVNYSTPLEKFEKSVINLFNQSVLSTHNVPQLDKFVLQKLFIHDVEILETVNLWEPEVAELRTVVHNCLLQALIPLRAYAAEYEKHVEFYKLDIKPYVRSLEEITPQELKEEFQHHLNEIDNIQKTMPASIVIGPFVVLVDTVKQSLIRKRKAVADAIRDHFPKQV